MNFYVVTSHKSDSVSTSLTAHFTSPSDLNLILSKSNRIEIHLFSNQSLKLVMDAPIFGRVSSITKIQSLTNESDKLLITTEKHQLSLLSWDPVQMTITTEQIMLGQGLRDLGARQSEYFGVDYQLASDGISTGGVVGICQSQDVRSFCFLRCSSATAKGKGTYKAGNKKLKGEGLDSEMEAIFLYKDVKNLSYVQTQQLSLSLKTLTPKDPIKVDDSSLFLIPVSTTVGGGYCVIAESGATWYSTDGEEACAIKPTFMTRFCVIDSTRFLLSDLSGNLYILLLQPLSSTAPKKIYCSAIGKTGQASSISYLSDGLVYVASQYGPSNLIKLSDTQDASLPCEVLQTHDSLGPLTDFILPPSQSPFLVTCSGAFEEGGLKIVRNGIGIEETAALDCSLLLGLWSLEMNHEVALIYSFPGESKAQRLEGGVLRGMDWLRAEETIFAGVNGEDIVQVTPIGVFVFRGMKQTASWKSDNILHASMTGNRVVVASGKKVVVLRVAGKIIEERGFEMDEQISCLNVSETHLAIGSWKDQSIRVFELESLHQVVIRKLDALATPHSILLICLEGVDYVLASTSNGSLYSSPLQALINDLNEEMKKTVLGVTPVTLTSFVASSTTYIFASSDRPTIIYSRSQKLLFSNVNLGHTYAIAPFSTPFSPNGVAIATKEGVIVGSIEDVRKLHVKNVPMSETARRVVYWEGMYAVLSSGEEGSDISNLRILDGHSFEQLDKFRFGEFEMAASSWAGVFSGGSEEEFLVVGTGFAIPGEVEAKKGRILVFRMNSGKLNLVSEYEIGGFPYSIVSIHGKLFIAVNSKVVVLEWIEVTQELVFETQHHGHVLALTLATRGDMIIVGDLMKSVTCLFYDPINKQLADHARDYDTHWMTAVESASSQVFIGADNNYNLFALQKDPDSSIVMRAGDIPTVATPLLMYCTVNGALGVIASLTDEVYHILDGLQTQMRLLPSIGLFDHELYRSFTNDRSQLPSSRMIDGDFVESFVDLPQETQEEIAGALLTPLTQLVGLLEDVSRVH